MIINSKKFITNSVNPDIKSRVIAEIYVDEKSELLESKEMEKYEFAQGSVAYVIKTGEFFIMDGDGIWRTVNGEAIS